LLININRLLANEKRLISMAEGRRYIAQKALKVNGEIVTDATVDINVNDTVSIGKHKEFTVTEEMLKVLDG